MRRLNERSAIVVAYLLVVLGGAMGVYTVHHQQRQFEHRVCEVIMSVTAPIAPATNPEPEDVRQRRESRNAQLTAEQVDLLHHLRKGPSC